MTAKHEAILERLMRLDEKACVRMRPTHQQSARWYVDLGHIVAAWLGSNGWHSFFENGSTPEEALERTWATIVARSANADAFFLRYDCKPDEPIPGAGSQVWVRWSEKVGDWVDVVPTAKALQARDTSADRVRPYARSAETVQHR